MTLVRDQKAMDWLFGHTNPRPPAEHQVPGPANPNETTEAPEIRKPTEPSEIVSISSTRRESFPARHNSVSVKEGSVQEGSLSAAIRSSMKTDTTKDPNKRPKIPAKDEKAIAWLTGHGVPVQGRKSHSTSPRKPTPVPLQETPAVSTAPSAQDEASVTHDKSLSIKEDSVSDDLPSDAIKSLEKSDTAKDIKGKRTGPFKDEKAIAWLCGFDLPGTRRAKPAVSPVKSTKSTLTEKPTTSHKATEELSRKSKSFKLPSNVSTYDNESENTETPLQLTSDSLLKIRTAEDFPVAKRKKSHSTWDISTDATPRDIRHEIAPENHMMRIDNMLSRRPYDLVEEDELLNSATFKNAFIKDWNSNVRCEVVVKMAPGDIVSFMTRDIDTFTGEYLPPVEQPPSKWDQGEYIKSTPQEKDHSENWTANFLIARENGIRAQRERRKNNQHPLDRYTAPPAVDKVIDETPDPVRPEVTADCILRPANWSDLEGIVNIYNDEIDRGLRAWDTEHVKTSDFNRIGEQCTRNQLPFIVAVHRRDKFNDDTGYPASTAQGRGGTQGNRPWIRVPPAPRLWIRP